MRKAFILLISVIAASMLLSGCGGTSGTTSGGDTTPFIGGSEGISIDFMDGAPPPEVYDGNNYPFEATLRLQNKGEHDVLADDVDVEITGIDPGDFGTTADALHAEAADEDLLGTMKDSNGNIIDGTISYLSFPIDGALNYVNTLSGNTLFTLRADLCYGYETVANTKLCVIKDVLNFNQEHVCEVNEKKTVYNSGGPVQITSFQQSPMGQDKISFTFEVSHAGLGEIFGKDTSCEDEVTNQGKVYIDVETGIGEGAECPGLEGGANAGYVTLYSGKRTVRCTQSIDASTNFEKVISITASYDYHQSVSKTLLVKHVS